MFFNINNLTMQRKSINKLNKIKKKIVQAKK